MKIKCAKNHPQTSASHHWHLQPHTSPYTPLRCAHFNQKILRWMLMFYILRWLLCEELFPVYVCKCFYVDVQFFSATFFLNILSTFGFLAFTQRLYVCWYFCLQLCVCVNVKEKLSEYKCVSMQLNLYFICIYKYIYKCMYVSCYSLLFDFLLSPLQLSGCCNHSLHLLPTPALHSAASYVTKR